jgi:acetyl-CoA synthetase
VLIDGDEAPEDALRSALRWKPPRTRFEVVRTEPEDPALFHFTSGTTGKPKGAVHVHEAVVYHTYSGRNALDLRPGDIYWCTADPGWVTGTSYGIIAPLTIGVTMIVDEAEFDAERWYADAEAQKVDGLVLRADGDPHADEGRRGSGREPYDLSSLTFMASVGEPLNPEAVIWGEEAFGRRSTTIGGRRKPAAS